MTGAAEMALRSSALILLTAAARHFAGKKLPMRLFTLLWLAAAVRMLLPFSLSIPLGNAEIITAVFSDTQAAYEYSYTANEAEQTVSERSLYPEAVVFAVYPAGVMLTAGAFAVSHLKFKRKYECSVPCTDEEILAITRSAASEANAAKRKISVRICETVFSPFTAGIFHPVIYLPKDMKLGKESLKGVICHEIVHITHFDPALKLIITAAVCLNWFNPLAWLMLLLSDRDIELACDDEVIGKYGIEAADYAMTLIGFAERGLPHTAAYFGANGAKALRERIEAIMKRSYKAGAAIIAAAVILTAAAAVFIGIRKPEPHTVFVSETSAAEASEASEPSQTQLQQDDTYAVTHSAAVTSDNSEERDDTYAVEHSAAVTSDKNEEAEAEEMRRKEEELRRQWEIAREREQQLRMEEEENSGRLIMAEEAPVNR